ncbi:hypothetical protein BDF20DRAFT_880805, partial [Mycotypha africana]|uniref:uncharacterized protein n=1 Tax=Mycotypha africana TaxID=64632 RepID=UPI0023005740
MSVGYHLPKRFFPFPFPSLHWRFITISINSLVPFLFPGTPPKGYLNQLEKFHQVFSFKTMGIKSLNDLKTSLETLFHGFTVDFIFSKKGKAKEEKTIENHRLTLKDFDLAEIEAGYRPCLIDPWEKRRLTAAIGLDDEKHQVRRCSTK